MYTLAITLAPRKFWLEQIPILLGSFLIAEFFYKFGSFALECIAFLATWFILDVITSFFTGDRKKDNNIS